jgi:hypothetical protein
MAVGRDGQNLIGAQRDESGSRDSSVNERYPHAPRSHGMTGRPRCARMRICVPPRLIAEESIAAQNGYRPATKD